MSDTLLNLLQQTMASPWVYLALFAFAAIDAFFPMVPSETAVITAGVFAATGEPSLSPIIGVAALGAFVGDHTSYLIGRTAGGRALRRMRPRTRRRAAYEWTGRALAERGGLALVVARYIPGGRTAVTVTMGATGYPARLFSLFDSIAAASWGAYGALVGYLGGVAFENDPVKGLLLGLALAITTTVLVEAARYLRRRARTRSPQATPNPSDSRIIEKAG